MKANGRMMLLMATENTSIQMGLNTSANGKTTNKTVMVSKPGQMEQDMKAITSKGKNSDKVTFLGTTDPATLEIFRRTKSKVKELIHGLTVECTSEIGEII